MVHVAPRRFFSREEGRSFSLPCIRWAVTRDALPRPSANAWNVWRARARIMHAPSCRISTYGETIAKALARIAMRGSRTVRAPGDERRDGRSTIRNLYSAREYRKDTAGSLATSLPKLYEHARNACRSPLRLPAFAQLWL